MKIETRFDLGQQVFFLNWSQREVIPATIESVKTEVCSDNFNGGEPFTTTIYFLNNGAWVAESTLFLAEEEAHKQRNVMMKQLIRDTILSILADKRADGEVLPFATSIEVAERMKIPVSEVEKIAEGIEGVVKGRTEEYEYYYE